MTRTDKSFLLSRLKICFPLVAVVLGALHAWHDRHFMFPDGIAYLDMGDAYLRGDWNMAINAYWSPFYSWLLAVAMLVIKPSSYWEFSVVHLVNFLIYLCAVGCFHFLLGELLSYNRERTARFSKNRIVSLPEWALLMLAYSFFIWSSVRLVTVAMVTPDMCIAAFVYVAAGILLRIRRGFDSWLTFVLLGVVLGFAYLAKAAMFPLAFVFIMFSAFLVGNLRRAIPRVLIALVGFLSIGGPFILAISQAEGHLSIGNAGRLNYEWSVNDRYAIDSMHIRRIFDNPTVYEFVASNRATYPFWYDPSKTYTTDVHINPIGQLRVLIDSANVYYAMFFYSEGGLLVGFLTLHLFGWRSATQLKNIAAYGSLFVPAIAGLTMYSLVLVTPRYVGAFFALFWMGIASSVRLPDSQESRRLITCVAILMLTILTVKIAASSLPATYSTVHDLIVGIDTSPHEQWEVARVLNRLGLRRGDKVAFIGHTFGAYWARLARIQIIAEINKRDQSSFWTGDPSVKSQVIEAFAKTGAKMIVTDSIPNHFAANGWRKIEKTHYYVHLL